MRLLKAAVCQTERHLSDIVDFSRNSFKFFRFADRASWLALGLETPFWPVAGTIVGTNVPAQRSWRDTPNVVALLALQLSRSRSEEPQKRDDVVDVLLR